MADATHLKIFITHSWRDNKFALHSAMTWPSETSKYGLMSSLCELEIAWRRRSTRGWTGAMCIYRYSQVHRLTLGGVAKRLMRPSRSVMNLAGQAVRAEFQFWWRTASIR